MKTRYWIVGYLLLTASACSSGGEAEKEEEKPVKQTPISLSCKIITDTRVTDYGYETSDMIGLYVVNYNGETPGTLTGSGNHVNNMRFTYNSNGQWNPDTNIYWKDEQTKADFYCYFPFASSPSSVTAHSFAVREDQSTEQAYKASDFLYGKTLGLTPTNQSVTITTYHLFSNAVISIQAGNGFTTESLSKATISVKINSIQTEASIDLTKGEATATGTAKSILPLRSTDALSYKALIVPQSASADNFITVNVDGRDFNLKKEFTFVGGKRYSIPVTVSKSSNGINVNVGAWEDDTTNNGGTAE